MLKRVFGERCGMLARGVVYSLVKTSYSPTELYRDTHGWEQLHPLSTLCHWSDSCRTGSRTMDIQGSCASHISGNDVQTGGTWEACGIDLPSYLLSRLFMYCCGCMWWLHRIFNIKHQKLVWDGNVYVCWFGPLMTDKMNLFILSLVLLFVGSSAHHPHPCFVFRAMFVLPCSP